MKTVLVAVVMLMSTGLAWGEARWMRQPAFPQMPDPPPLMQAPPLPQMPPVLAPQTCTQTCFPHGYGSRCITSCN